MKTKFRIENQDAITFLRSLEAESVDIIVTDPAYSGMNNKLKLGKGRIVGKYSEKGDGEKWFTEFEDTPENYHAFLSECKRVLRRDTGHIYIMFDSFSLLTLGPIVREYFDVKNLITWDKVNMGMGHYFRRRQEFIIFSTNNNTRHINTRSLPDVWRFKRIYNAAYSTQKPTEVFKAMLEASANDGFVVCDPFLGSGSSAIAALQSNCMFIGCDIANTAVQLATNRINEFIKTGKDPLQPKSAIVD